MQIREQNSRVLDAPYADTGAEFERVLDAPYADKGAEFEGAGRPQCR